MNILLSSKITITARRIVKDIGKPINKRLAFIYTSYEYVNPTPN